MDLPRLVSTRDDAAEEEIAQRLVAYNQAHAPARAGAPELEPLQIFARNAADQLVGGLIGRLHRRHFWLEITILWVDEGSRRQGLGARMVGLAERNAAARGCHYARLATSDCQAPSFYARLGYVVYGELENCPPGEKVSYFWKPLPPTVTASGC